MMNPNVIRPVIVSSVQVDGRFYITVKFDKGKTYRYKLDSYYFFDRVIALNRKKNPSWLKELKNTAVEVNQVRSK